MKIITSVSKRQIMYLIIKHLEFFFVFRYCSTIGYLKWLSDISHKLKKRERKNPNHRDQMLQHSHTSSFKETQYSKIATRLDSLLLGYIKHYYWSQQKNKRIADNWRILIQKGHLRDKRVREKKYWQILLQKRRSGTKKPCFFFSNTKQV